MRFRHQSLLACLLGVVVAVPALAQSGGSVTTYAACPNPPPKLSPVELDAARASWRVANEAYAKGDYPKALTNLKDAFSRDCSRVELLTQIALIYELLGNKAEALHALETYVQRSPKATDADTVRDKIQKLRAALASTAAPTPTVTATATATATPTVTATPTATEQPPPPPRSGGHTAGPWIVVGAGAAATIAGVVMLSAGAAMVMDVHNNCAGSGDSLSCPNGTTGTWQAKDNTGVLLENVGWITGGVGLAAIAGGLIWHFLEPTGQKSAALAPVVGPQYAGLSLSGSF